MLFPCRGRSPRPRLPLFLAAAISAALSFAAATTAAAQDLYWTGGSGTWNNTAKWSTSPTFSPTGFTPTLSNLVITNTDTAASTISINTGTSSALGLFIRTRSGVQTINGTSADSNAFLQLGSSGIDTNGQNLTLGSNLTVLLDSSQQWRQSGPNSTHRLNISGLVRRTGTAALSMTLKLAPTASAAGRIAVSGTISDGGTSGNLGVWVEQPGSFGSTAVDFNAAQAYTGSTTVNRGILTAQAGHLPSASTLVMGSGVLSLSGSTNTTQTQTVNGLTLRPGMGYIALSSATSGTTVVNLGAITRAGGGGVISFGTSNVAAPAATRVFTTTNTNTRGMLGPWAVIGLGNAATPYAQVVGGTIQELTYSSTSTVNDLTSGSTNYLLNANGTLTASRTAHTVATGSSNTITLGSFDLTVNGLNGVNVTASGGRLVIGNTNELVILTRDSAGNQIGVPIVDGAGGAGRVVLAGDAYWGFGKDSGLSSLSTFSGGLTYVGSTQHGALNSGNSALYISSQAAPASTPIITSATASPLGTGTFTITGGRPTIYAWGTIGTNNAQVWDADFIVNTWSSSAVSREFNIGTGPVSLGLGAGPTRTVNVVNGTFTVGGDVSNGTYADLPVTSLVKSGEGTLVLSGSLLYTGATGVSAGTLLITGTNPSTMGPMVASGGVLQFARQVSLYGGGTSNYTAANLTTGSGAVLAVNVGGTGEFTSSDLDTLKGLGTELTGFLPGSFLGIDTTNVSSGTFTYASNIANTNGGTNAFGIAKLGGGTLVLTPLSGSNTFTGGVSVRGGTLLLTSTNQIGTGPMTLAGGTLSTSSDAFMTSSPLTFSGGALRVTGTSLTSLASGRTTTFTAATPVILDIADAANAFTVGQVLNQTTGNLVKLGPGTLVLTSSNTYTGTTVIGAAGGPTGGTLRLSGAGWISGTTGTAAPLIYSGTLDTNGINVRTGLLTLGGGAAATSAGVTTSTGTLTLAGNVTYDATNNPGGSTIGGNVSLGNASRTFTVGDSTGASNDLTVSAAITSGTLTKAGAGVLLLSGTNTYAGVTTVSAGALVANSTASLPGWNTNGYTVSAGGVLAMGSGFSNVESGTVIAGGTFAANSSVGFDTSGANRDYNTVIPNAGGNARGLVKLGSGTLTLSAVNTYTGTTAVNEGTLRIGLANAISGTSPLVLAGNGSLDLANAISAAAVTLSGSGSIFGSATLTGSSYTINNTAGTTTVSAILGGTATTVTLTKSNAGTAVLSGLNTYSGTTTVSGGVLEFNSIANTGTANASALGAPATGNGTITLGSSTASATLRYTGTGHSSNRQISTGSAGGIVDASGSGALNMSSGTISAASNSTVTLTGSSTFGNSIGPINGPTTTDNGVNVTKTGPGLWQITGDGNYSGQLTVLDGTIVAGANVNPDSTTGAPSPFGRTNPIVGNSAANITGTAAILAIGSGTINRGLSIAALDPSSSQVAVLGMTGTGTAVFSTKAISVGRDLTLQASNGGTAEFNSIWAGASGTSGPGPAVVFTVGSAGNAGTVRFGSDLPSTLTGVTVVDGTAQLKGSDDRIMSATPVTVGSTIGAATLDLNGLSQTLSRLTFAGNSGRVTTGTVANGMLRLANSGSVAVSGTGHVISSLVDLVVPTTFNTGSASALTVSSVISSTGGAMGITKTGLGTLTLSAANTYSGVTNVNAGTLALRIANALSNSTAVSVAGGTLDLGAFNDQVDSLTLTSGSVTGSGGTLTAATYSLGGGAVSANLGGGTLNVTGNASLTGNSAATVVNLNAGGLTLGGGSRLTGSPVVTGSSGASLALGGNDSFGSLAGFANIGLGGNRLTVGSANSNTTYSGVLSGAGGLTKTGTGVFTLAGNNTYSGSTSIDAGTFVVNGSLGSGALSVAAAATLMGSGTIGGAATIAGIHSPGNSPGIETFSSDLTYSGGLSQVIWELWGNTVSNSPLAYDQIVVGGNLNFAGLTSLVLDFGGSGFGSVNWNNSFWGTDRTWTLFDVSASGTTSNFSNFSLVNTPASWLDSNGLAFASSTRKDNTFTVSQQGSDVLLRYTVVVPEPASLALAAIGIATAAWAARRRK